MDKNNKKFSLNFLSELKPVENTKSLATWSKQGNDGNAGVFKNNQFYPVDAKNIAIIVPPEVIKNNEVKTDFRDKCKGSQTKISKLVYKPQQVSTKAIFRSVHSFTSTFERKVHGMNEVRNEKESLTTSKIDNKGELNENLDIKSSRNEIQEPPREEFNSKTPFGEQNSPRRISRICDSHMKNIFNWGSSTDDYSLKRSNSSFTSLKTLRKTPETAEKPLIESISGITDNNNVISEISEKFVLETRILNLSLSTDNNNDEKLNVMPSVKRSVNEKELKEKAIINHNNKTEIAMNIPKDPFLHESEENLTNLKLKTLKSLTVENLDNNANTDITPNAKPSVNSKPQNTKKKELNLNGKMQKAAKKRTNREEIKKRLEELRKNQLRIVSRNIKKARKQAGAGNTNNDNLSVKSDNKSNAIPDTRRNTHRESLKGQDQKSTNADILLTKSVEHTNNGKNVSRSQIKSKEKINNESENLHKSKGSAKSATQSTSKCPSKSTIRTPIASKTCLNSGSENPIDRIKFDSQFGNTVGILRKTDIETEPLYKNNESNQIANAESNVINDMQIIASILESASNSEKEKLKKNTEKIGNIITNEKPDLSPTDDLKLKIPDVKLQTKISTNEQFVQVPISSENLPPNREDILHMLRPSPVQVYPYNFIMAVRKKLEAVTNPSLSKNYEEPKEEIINKIKESLTTNQEENYCNEAEQITTNIRDPNLMISSQETNNIQTSSNVLNSKENIHSSVASYTPICSNDANDMKSYKSSIEDKSVKSISRSKSEASSKTISELPHSNFSSISIHVPDSRTTSEVSSLHSEIERQSSQSKKPDIANEKQQSTSSEKTYTNKANLEERNDDDTTVSSSVFSSPEKRALREGIQRKLETVDIHLDITSLLIGKNVNNDILQNESKLTLKTTNEKNDNLLEVPKVRLDDKILKKNKNTESSHNNSKINANKFVEDFHKSLAGVIDKNTRLKHLTDVPISEETSRKQITVGDSKILKAKKGPNFYLGDVDYSSDFEEVLTSKRDGTGDGSTNKLRSVSVEHSSNADITESEISNSKTTAENSDEQKEKYSDATSSKSITSNLYHSGHTTQENNLKSSVIKDNSQSQNYSSSIVTRHQETTSNNENQSEINTQQYSFPGSSTNIEMHSLDKNVSELEISGREQKSSSDITPIKSSSKSSIKSAITEENLNQFSGKSSIKSAIVEESVKEFSENSITENDENMPAKMIRKSSKIFSKTQHSKGRLELSEYSKNLNDLEQQDKVNLKENVLKFVNSSRGDFISAGASRDDSILENTKKKKHLSSSKDKKGECIFDNSMESAPPAYHAKDAFKYSNALDTSSTGTGMFTVFDQSNVDLSTTSRNGSMSESSINYSSIGWYEQLLQKENSKSRHLTALLKIREKSLLDRARAQVLLLEMQKQKYKMKGLTADVSATKKKQRAIILKMQRKKDEIRRLFQCQENNRRKEKNEHIEDLRSQFIRRNLFNESNRIMPEIVLRRNSLPSEVKPTVTVDKSKKIVKGYELRGSHSLERFLEEREKELKRRRAQVEHLLEWHQRLDKEEQDISELEKRLLGQNVKNNTKSVSENYYNHMEKLKKKINNIEKGLKELREVPSGSTSEETINSSESSCRSKCYRVKGRDLNKLWRRLIRRKEEKFLPDKEYSVNKENIELLYEEAKLEVLRDFGKESGLNFLEESEYLEESKKAIKFGSLKKNVQIQTSIKSNESSPERIKSKVITTQSSSNNDENIESIESLKSSSSSNSIKDSNCKILVKENLNGEKNAPIREIRKSFSDSEISTKTSRKNEIKSVNTVISSDKSFLSNSNTILKENFNEVSHHVIQNNIEDISLNHTDITEYISIEKSTTKNENKQEFVLKDNSKQVENLKTVSSSETEKLDTIAEVSSLSNDLSISNSTNIENSIVTTQSNNEKTVTTSGDSQKQANSITRSSVIISTYSVQSQNASNGSGDASTLKDNSFPTYKSSKENDKIDKCNENKLEDLNLILETTKQSEINKEDARTIESLTNEINESTFIRNISIPKFEELLDTSASERSSQIADTFSTDSDQKLNSNYGSEKNRELPKGITSPSELKKRLIDIDDSLKDLNDSFECALSPKKLISPISSNLSIFENQENNLPKGSDFLNASGASSSSSSLGHIIVHQESSLSNSISEITFAKDDDSSKQPNQFVQQQPVLNENDIKHLEHAVPYVFLREIPNKPPPPYVPPAHGSPMTTIFPSEDRIRDITFRRVKELYQEVFLPGVMKSDVENSSNNRNLSILDENITNIYERIILDICKEWIQELRENYDPNPELYRNRLKLFNPPNQLQCFQEAVYKDVRKFLGMDRRNNIKNNTSFMSSQVSWYNRRKRDHINDILIQELYEEEQKWTTFDREEMEVRETVIDEIFEDVLGQALNDVLTAHKM